MMQTSLPALRGLKDGRHRERSGRYVSGRTAGLLRLLDDSFSLYHIHRMSAPF